MDYGLVTQALVGSGPLGLLILYLIYTRRQDREDDKMEREERRRLEERRVEADLKMAAAITTLAMRITGTPDV